MRNFFILALVAQSAYCVQAQNLKGAIQGIVNDTHNKPMPGATILLTRIKDSSFHKTTAANERGEFEFKNIDIGAYLLAATNIGCAGYISDPIPIDEKHLHTVLPVILLRPTDAKVLKDVAVNAKVPLLEQRIDKLVVNVDALISNAGSNALEVLAKSPGVMVSADGDISLNGRNGVLVLIENKPTYLSSQDLANYLRSISSGMLDKIELMSNPPAKYDASGREVINIILKKNKAKGFNGNLTAGYTQGVYGKVNDALNFNYRNKKYNLFGNMSYNSGDSYADESNNRYYYNADGSPNSTVTLDSRDKYKNKAFNGRVGLDYFLSPKTTWGIVLNGLTRPRQERLDYVSNQYNSNMKLDSVGSGYTDGKYKWRNEGINMNFQHKFDNSGKEISADLNYITYSSRGDQTSPNYMYLPDGTMTSYSNIIYAYPTDINIYSAKADYTHPITKHARFDAGIKSSLVRTDNLTEYYDQMGNIRVEDYGKTNHFIYKETVNAAYVNISEEWRRWGVQAGLRMENTFSKGHQPANAIIADSSFERKYTDLFPTFYLSHKLDSLGKHTIVLSYGRRVTRPNYQQLNPFLLYHDKYTYTAGNPYLKASYNYHIELSYRYKQYLIFAPFYDHVAGIIFPTTESSGSVFITRPGNIANGHMYGFSTNLSLSPAKWWTVNFNAFLAHVINKGLIYTEYLNQSITSGGFNIVNQARFSKSWSAELSVNYESRMIAGQTVRDAVYTVNAGVQKVIWKDKGTIKLKMDDIFHSLVSHEKTTDIQQAIGFHGRETDSRAIGLILSYRFGRQANARKRNHVTGGTDDEENRANN